MRGLTSLFCVQLKTTPLVLLSADHAIFSTRRHAFLTQMRQLLPWAELVALVSPYYYAVESGRGRPRVDLELRLRLYCLPQGYDLSGPATEEEVTDSLSMRHFAGLSWLRGCRMKPRSALAGTSWKRMPWERASSH